MHFDEITSIFPYGGDGDDGGGGGSGGGGDAQLLHAAGTLRSEPEEQEEDDEEQGGEDRCYACNTLLERRSVRKFFRFCAVFSLLSLAFSAPLRVCSEAVGSNSSSSSSMDLPEEEEEDCEGVFIQFVVITAVDLILALIYTVQLGMRIQYTTFLCSRKSNRVCGGACGCGPA